MHESDCVYDYANKCDCSEDDKCGCTYPNNMPHDFDCEVKNVVSNLTTETGNEYSKTDFACRNLLPGISAWDFTADTVMPDNQIKTDFNLYQYLHDSYGLIFFYPADFTFVCPSELVAYNKLLDEFSKRNIKIVAISVDSQYAHLTWKKLPYSQGGIENIQIPLVADTQKNISRQYGVLKPDGTAFRASFIIDRNKIVRHISINDDKIGRNPLETLRIIDAIQFIETHGGVCPAGWQLGEQSINPTPEGVAQYLSQL